ncbi:MAG: hypothetical protein GX565_15980 [Lentisphaerae bacterium]|jgi:DNA helicase TIP49 (TBP-interacting protein)|nr:hypothetical protein [Lentisphaerota bacterium]
MLLAISQEQYGRKRELLDERQSTLAVARSRRYAVGTMTVAGFIAKWRKVELKERSAAQEHFLDLCHVFDHPTPAEADPSAKWRLPPPPRN